MDDHGIDLDDMLIDHEGEKLKPYKDLMGHWIIGVGHNIDADPAMRKHLGRLLKTGITEAQAMSLLHTDIAKVKAGLDKYLPWWRCLSERRQAVLVDMGFNIGVPGLQKFKRMLKFIQEGQYKEAAAALLHSRLAKQTGRRARELAQWLRGT